MKQFKPRELLSIGAVPCLLFALSGAACRGQNAHPTLVGYEPTMWRFTYATELRDEVFSKIPFGGLAGKGSGQGQGSAKDFCLGQHFFGYSNESIGIMLFDNGHHRGAEEFYYPPNTVPNEEQIYADESRVVCVGVFDAWTWERQSRRLLTHWNLRRGKDEEVALTSTFYAPRAGVILQAVGPQLRTWSARTGQLLRVVPHLLADFDAEYGEAKEASHVVFSPAAAECFYNTTIYTSKPDPTSDEIEPRDRPPGPTHIASCASGETLWTIDPVYNVAFGGDGATVLAQREGAPVVEVRAARTGRVIRKVDVRPDCTVLGSSRDGQTLYSHDGAGRVWKQRLD